MYQKPDTYGKTRIPAKLAATMVGEFVTLSWSSPGTFWQLMAVDGDRVVLQTTKGVRKVYQTADLCYVPTQVGY